MFELSDLVPNLKCQPPTYQLERAEWHWLSSLVNPEEVEAFRWLPVPRKWQDSATGAHIDPEEMGKNWKYACHACRPPLRLRVAMQEFIAAVGIASLLGLNIGRAEERLLGAAAQRMIQDHMDEILDHAPLKTQERILDMNSCPAAFSMGVSAWRGRAVFYAVISTGDAKVPIELHIIGACSLDDMVGPRADHT